MSTAERTEAPPRSGTGTVAVPRWALRIFLGLCPYFAVLIAVHAGSLMAAGVRAQGWLDTLFWVAVVCFSVSSLGAVLVYLAGEPALNRRSRLVLGGIASAMMAVTAVMAVAMITPA